MSLYSNQGACGRSGPRKITVILGAQPGGEVPILVKSQLMERPHSISRDKELKVCCGGGAGCRDGQHDEGSPSGVNKASARHTIPIIYAAAAFSGPHGVLPALSESQTDVCLGVSAALIESEGSSFISDSLSRAPELRRSSGGSSARVQHAWNAMSVDAALPVESCRPLDAGTQWRTFPSPMLPQRSTV